MSELRGTTKPFTSLEAAVSRNMLESKSVPEFRVAMSITTNKLDAMYAQLKPKGVTMTALLAKACAAALASHPVIYAGEADSLGFQNYTRLASGLRFKNCLKTRFSVAWSGREPCHVGA